MGHTSNTYTLSRRNLILTQFYLWTQNWSQSESACLTAALHRRHASAGPKALQRVRGRRCKYFLFYLR